MKKPTADRKREIVETALTLTAASGVGALSTTAVAGMIGISQPAIFRHFPTKAALWQGVGAYLAEEMSKGWDAVVVQPVAAQDRLLALADAQLSFIARYPAVLDIVFSRQLHHDDPVLRADFQRLMAGLFAHFETLLHEAGPGLSPEAARDAGLVIAGTIQATALRWSLGGKGFDLVAEGRRLIVRQIGWLYQGAAA